MTKDVPHDKAHGFVDGTESTHRILLSIGQWASGSVKFCAHELTRLYGIPEGSPTQQGTPAFIMGVADRIEHAADVLLNRLRAETPQPASLGSPETPQEDAAPPASWIEKRLRQEWWTGHGCGFSSLYGDDGEMQCNAATCMRDFKREPIEQLRSHVEARRLIRAAAALNQPPSLLAAPEGKLRDVVGRILWSKVTEIGGGKCYLETNLDDVADELEAALAPLAEPPASGIYPRGHGPKP